MKRLLLSVSVLALLSLPASARTGNLSSHEWNARYNRGTPEWNARYNCSFRLFLAYNRAGDPRFRRYAAMRRAGVGAGYAVLSKDGQSLIHSATRYCAARGQ
jgi:hypothetical protein